MCQDGNTPLSKSYKLKTPKRRSLAREDVDGNVPLYLRNSWDNIVRSNNFNDQIEFSHTFFVHRSSRFVKNEN